MSEEVEDHILYKVVLSDEKQYSIWPNHRQNPRGWKDAGKIGTKAECLMYIREAWLDMRPGNIRETSSQSAAHPKAY